MPDDFRITFFYGPEELTDRPDSLQCVFNVKKRRWKGGVQVGVALTKDQLARHAEHRQLAELVEMIRAKVEPEVFPDYEQRVRDLFVQQVCWIKLDLAVARGIEQANQTISPDDLVYELDREIAMRGDRIREAILTELDL